MGDHDHLSDADIPQLSLDPAGSYYEEEPALMSPIRGTSRHTSHHTSGESSVEYDSSFSIPGIELSFGPQTAPFILRRRAVTTAESPIKAPQNTPASIKATRVISMPAVRYHRDPTDDVCEGDADEASDNEVLATPILLSTWRYEQIKFTRKARMSKDPKIRPIPTLHGPLSLPYARNPR